MSGGAVPALISNDACLLIDIEGTLYDDGEPVAGAIEAVHMLRTTRRQFRFLSNTDSRTPGQMAERLRDMGFGVADHEVFAPLSAAAALLDRQTLALMPASLTAHLPPADAEQGYTQVVVVGDCREILDYNILDAAFRALRAGAELVAMQRGRYFKRTDGDHLDTGAIVAALEYAAGVEARVIGKPSPSFFSLAAGSMGQEPHDCVVIGDDATTDIIGGAACGAVTIQVRTGKYADQRLEGIETVADHVVESFADVPAFMVGEGSL